MAPQPRNLLDRFVAHPPTLEGDVRLDVRRHGPRRAVLTFEHGDQVVEVVAAPLTVPYRSGLERLKATDGQYDAVIVERIPAGFAAAAREHGVSYMDLEGNGRVVAPGFVYAANAAGGRPRPRKPPHSSPFAPKASRVVRVLLVDPGAKWSLAELSRTTRTDAGNAHRVLGTLVNDGFVERDGDRYRAVDPGGLIQAWAESVRPPAESVILPSGDDLLGSVRAYSAAFRDALVVSGELAAELIAPYLRAESAVLHCVDQVAWDAFLASDRARFAFPGDRRLVVDLADEGVADFSRRHEDVPLASPVQVYVDLYRESGRGREAAEHLRSHVLEY